MSQSVVGLDIYSKERWIFQNTQGTVVRTLPTCGKIQGLKAP